jgi:hypothetical protein
MDAPAMQSPAACPGGAIKTMAVRYAIPQGRAAPLKRPTPVPMSNDYVYKACRVDSKKFYRNHSPPLKTIGRPLSRIAYRRAMFDIA